MLIYLKICLVMEFGVKSNLEDSYIGGGEQGINKIKLGNRITFNFSQVPSHSGGCRKKYKVIDKPKNPRPPPQKKAE